MAKGKSCNRRGGIRVLQQPEQRSADLAVLQPELCERAPQLPVALLVAFTRHLVRLFPSGDAIAFPSGDAIALAALAAQDDTGATDEQLKLMSDALFAWSESVARGVLLMNAWDRGPECRFSVQLGTSEDGCLQAAEYRHNHWGTMSHKVSRATYEVMIAEDLAWLEKQPCTLERQHISLIVERSADHEYGAEEINRAFYELTVAQRDRAWREIEALKKEVVEAAEQVRLQGHELAILRRFLDDLRGRWEPPSVPKEQLDGYELAGAEITEQLDAFLRAEQRRKHGNEDHKEDHEEDQEEGCDSGAGSAQEATS